MGLFTVDTVSQMIYKALSELGCSLQWCWPGGEYGYVNERNISLFIAHVLRENGFICFHEANVRREDIEKGKKGYIDLLAINCKQDTIIGIESKKINTTNNAKKFHVDLLRLEKYLKKFRPAKFEKYSAKNKFGVLAAITPKNDISEWWVVDENKIEHEPKKIWANFGKDLERIVGNDEDFYRIPLSRDDDDIHDAIFCVFQIKK